jgi:hypothetical protein
MKSGQITKSKIEQTYKNNNAQIHKEMIESRVAISYFKCSVFNLKVMRYAKEHKNMTQT